MQLLAENIFNLCMKGHLPLNWYWSIHLLHAVHTLLLGCSLQIFLFGSNNHVKNLWMTSNLAIHRNPVFIKIGMLKKPQTNKKEKATSSLQRSLGFFWEGVAGWGGGVGGWGQPGGKNASCQEHQIDTTYLEAPDTSASNCAHKNYLKGNFRKSVRFQLQVSRGVLAIFRHTLCFKDICTIM